MKKIALFICLFAFANGLMGQSSYKDGFESYDIGKGLAASTSRWSTASGIPGGTDDPMISSEAAATGQKSIKFAAKNGDMASVLLPFTGVTPNEGILTFRMSYMVKSGYEFTFNFANLFRCTFFPNQWMEIRQNLTEVLYNGYAAPYNTWANFKVRVDLNTGFYEIYIDDNIVAVARTANQVDYFHIFINQSYTELFVDDVEYSYEKTAPAQRDLNLREVSFITRGLAGQSYATQGKVMNLGTDPVTSFRLRVTSAGKTTEQAYTGLNITTGKQYTYTIGQPVALEEGNNNIKTEIIDVNGLGTDEQSSNDALSKQAIGHPSADHKGVLVEELTATWCGPCREVAPYIDELKEAYAPKFIPVAVHLTDDFSVEEYDKSVINSVFNTGGIPNAILNRNPNTLYPYSLEAFFLPEVLSPAVKAVIESGAEFNQDSRHLRFSATFHALEKISASHKYMAIITEDKVQEFESSMNSVARYLFNGFYGKVIGSDIEAGHDLTFNFETIVADEYDISNLNIICVLLKPDGTVENAYSATFDEAVKKGLIATSEVTLSEQEVTVYPNPATSSTHIKLFLDNPAEVHISLVNVAGVTLKTDKKALPSGISVVPFQTKGMTPGTYFLHIRAGSTSVVRKLRVEE